MSDRNDREATAQDDKRTSGAEKGTEGTALGPTRGGGQGGNGDRAASGAAESGHPDFDPGRAYTGSDIDPGEVGGAGISGTPGGGVTPGVSGNATGGVAGGTAANPGSGTAGGLGGRTAGASGMQTVAGGNAVGRVDTAGSTRELGDLGTGKDQPANAAAAEAVPDDEAGSRPHGATDESGST